MTMTKHRLEAFSDGVMTIIITIMVLSIPLPDSFEVKEILYFATSLFIYLLSFLVVGAFWNKHHYAFMHLEKVNQKIIVANLFFLFFLSLIPLFTKWVIENKGDLIPVIGYDIVYMAVSFFYVFSFRLILQESGHDRIKEMIETMKTKRILRPRSSWRPFLGLLAIVSGVILVSVFLPRVSTFILMGIPVTSSILDLFSSDRRSRLSKFAEKKNKPIAQPEL